MLKKYPILSFAIGIVLLIIFVISIVFIVRTVTTKDDTAKYTLSKLEEINVDVSDKELNYFESFDFVGKSTEDVKSELKNVVLAQNDLIRMQNVKLFSTSGTFELFITENKITSCNFVSKEIVSADDAVVIINDLNKKFASKTKQKEKDLVFFYNDTPSDYTSPSDLYNAGTYLEVSYKINDTTINLRTEKSGDKYIVKIYN